MPSAIISNFVNKVNKNALIAFFSAMVSGVLTHLFIMTNKVFNYNEFSVLFLDKEEMTLGRMAEGRWFVGFIGQLIGDNYSMQMVTGIIGIMLLAVSAGMLVSLLSLKNRLYAVLLGGVLVVFPAVTSFMAFTQLGDAWFLSVFLAVWAVYICERWKWGHFAGLVMVGLSLAIHQAYVSVAIAVMFLVIFKAVYEQEAALKELFRKIIRYLVILIGGFVFYYIGVKVSAAVFDYSLSSYHGINEMTSFTIRGIAKGIVYSYIYFFEYFFTTKYLFSYVWVVVDVLLALTLLYYVVRSSVSGFKGGNKSNGILRILLVVLLPLGMNGLPVLLADRVGDGVDRYMMYSLVMLWVLILFVADRMESVKEEQSTLKTLFLWVITAGICLHIGHDYVMDNQAYYRAQAVTEQTTSYLNRIAARMEAVEGWNTDIPVHFVMDGELFGSQDVALKEFEELAELRGTAYEPNYSASGVARFMQYYLHFPVNLATRDQIMALEEHAEYRQMNLYPAEDSVKIIDGVLVVKLSETEVK